MLVYGRNVAKDLLEKNKKIKKIYLQDTFNDNYLKGLIEKRNLNIEVCSKNKIEDLSSGVTQGIILDIPDYSYKDFHDVLNDDNQDFVVLLDHIEDSHNFGAIIRTCEAAGVKTIIIPNKRQVPVNATVWKTSVGTLSNVDVVMVSNISNAIDRLKEVGYWVVGTALENSVDYRSIDYSSKIALVIGNEGEGISNLVAKKCDFIAKIPMYGTTNSLNASVAAGIMIYEVIRNRK